MAKVLLELSVSMDGYVAGRWRSNSSSGVRMPKALFEASYTLDGPKGVQVREEPAGVSFHSALGDRDAYVIVDLPDHESAAAVALTRQLG